MQAISQSAAPPSQQIPWKTGIKIDTNAPVVPLKRWGRMTFTVVVALLVAQIIYSLAINPYISWPVVAEFLFSPNVLTGLSVTIQISLLSVVISPLIVLLIIVGNIGLL